MRNTWDCYINLKILLSFFVFFSIAAPQTGLKFEIWNNIPGNLVDDLRKDSVFPNNPSMTQNLTEFDTPNKHVNNYGARVTTIYLVRLFHRICTCFSFLRGVIILFLSRLHRLAIMFSSLLLTMALSSGSVRMKRKPMQNEF